MEILEYSKHNIIVFDGAMGTMLQQSGLKIGECPEVFNMTSKHIVKNIYEQYALAGANIITANTFGANALKLEGTGYTVDEIITSAVTTAKEVANAHNIYVALDIGPIGELLEPMGTLTFDNAYELFKAQVIAGVKAGCDAIIIETMTDLLETKCAILAVKENCNLPIFCTMSFEENMHTFVGVSISSMALTLEALGVDFLGINCSLGPAEMLPMVEELIKWTNAQIIIQPNAGMPCIVDGKTIYNISPKQFASEMEKFVKLGVSVIGGCCGTTPEFTRLLSDLAKTQKIVKREHLSITAVCSSSKTVEIDRVRIIGERINPTGKKRFKKALIDGDIDYILSQAIEQVEAGADILDVNIGLPEIDEKQMMIKAVKAIQSIVDTPLQIDSTNADVLEAGLRYYNGVAIVNSVNGDDESLNTVLPLVKKYGACVVGLTLDGRGIPRTAQARLIIAEKIVDKALLYGIKRENVFIDALALTTSAEQEISYETINAIKLIKATLNVKTLLGVSNISFGLPAREKMNQVFLTLALNAGLDLPIINPNVKDMVDTIYCFHQLKNIDKGSIEYISRFSNLQSDVASNIKLEKGISFYIKKGLRDETGVACKLLLTQSKPLDIVNNFLIPTLDDVGRDYESGKIFLPQLLQSAEAAKIAFEIIKTEIAKTATIDELTSEKIILATVQGDIHDIGKNIVKVILENYGYDVIDLGRDVNIQTVLDETIKHKANLVGLSALMTTTLVNMKSTISLLKTELPDTKIMVGGAVLTSDYASDMGADFYARDAVTAVAIAKGHFEREEIRDKR